jgi:putative transposase
MTKLSNKRVKFVIKAVLRGEASSQELARCFEVTPRRIRQLVAEYRKTGEVPTLSKERRPKTFLTEEQKLLVEKAYEESRLSATLLRLHIQKKYAVSIPHNKIHAYLKQKGLAYPDEKKQKQRKYCRYQRDHSGSLIHLDWHEREDGVKVLPIIDDASRKILAIGEYPNISTENAIYMLNSAVEHARSYNTYIRELNSDRDTTFMTTKGTPLFDEHKFQQALRKHSIKFIPSRAHHPQTNGKNERWFQEYDKHRNRFNTAEEFVEWYNDRVHGGLNRREGITPNEAFMQKLQPEAILGLFYKNIIGEKT